MGRHLPHKKTNTKPMASFQNLIHDQDRLRRPAAPQGYQQQPQQQQQQQPQKNEMVLYVWGGEEPSSDRALRLAQEVGVLDKLNVIDIRDLRMSDIPEWLEGVPTLLSVQEETIWKGTGCLQHIQEMAYNPELYQTMMKPSQQRNAGATFADAPMQEVNGVMMRQRMPEMMRGMAHDDAVGSQPQMALSETPLDKQQTRLDFPTRQQQQQQPPPQPGSAQGSIQMPDIMELQKRQQQQQQQPAAPVQQASHDNRLPTNMSEDKVSANDMPEIEEILKRREQMMQQAPQR